MVRCAREVELAAGVAPVAMSLLLAALVDCGTNNDLTAPDDGGPNNDAAPSIDASDDDGPGFGNLVGDGAVQDASDGCSEAATLVYVTGSGSQLWSFYPPKLKFTLIGTFNCLTNPSHMTVDRQATAWVKTDNAALYKASTKDASCQAVPTYPASDHTYPDSALTFIGTMGVDNTLYLMGLLNLGKFDLLSGSLTTIADAPIGSLGIAKGDMTSNGDGTLYFLMDDATPTLYNIDPASGMVLSKSPLNATGGGTAALAFWGGSFWAFENNVIYEYDPVKKTTTARGNAPLSVTGAGQSTCVPRVPPPTM